MTKVRYWNSIFAALCLASTPLAKAKAPFGMAGCGLGSMIFGSQGPQLLASTTNQTLANQLFGMTSGTSNCVEPSKAVAENAQQTFIQENFSTLSKEIAQGDGNTLKAFSDTFGCSKETYPAFAQQLQGSYEEIFAAPGSLAALSVIVDELHSNAVAAKGCSYLL
ncbi:MAG: DUF3015 family protein [Oligoflexus sp.]|nr:DUF3015 family protein [Oligoflexus sp.]